MVNVCLKASRATSLWPTMPGTEGVDHEARIFSALKKDIVQGPETSTPSRMAASVNHPKEGRLGWCGLAGRSSGSCKTEGVNRRCRERCCFENIRSTHST